MHILEEALVLLLLAMKLEPGLLELDHVQEHPEHLGCGALVAKGWSCVDDEIGVLPVASPLTSWCLPSGY